MLAHGPGRVRSMVRNTTLSKECMIDDPIRTRCFPYRTIDRSIDPSPPPLVGFRRRPRGRRARARPSRDSRAGGVPDGDARVDDLDDERGARVRERARDAPAVRREVRIASHRIASHRIASHRIVGSNARFASTAARGRRVRDDDGRREDGARME